MVTNNSPTNQPTNQVNLVQVRLWNSKKVWLLQQLAIGVNIILILENCIGILDKKWKT